MISDRSKCFLDLTEFSGADISPSEKLEKVTQLAELCIELIQQNEEHHAEVCLLLFSKFQLFLRLRCCLDFLFINLF